MENKQRTMMTSWHRRRAIRRASTSRLRWRCVALASSVVPPSHASESLAAFAAFSSEGDAVERARDVLDRLETLPQIETIPLWLFVMTLSEMLPLFPSQPAALTSGIVFGATEGAAMVLVANMTAATLAFLAARGAGRLGRESRQGGGGERDRGDETATGRYETAYGGDADDGEDVDNAFARKWAELRANLAESEPTRQATLIALYRLTPHPFSASNYLFGLVREVRLAPYLVGTCVGAIPYAILYAGAGAYGRTLLDGGEAFETAFARVREIVESDLEIGEEGARWRWARRRRRRTWRGDWHDDATTCATRRDERTNERTNEDDFLYHHVDVYVPSAATF